MKAIASEIDTVAEPEEADLSHTKKAKLAQLNIIEEDVPEEAPPPDGGWDAIGVVAASFAVHFLCIGVLYCFGIFSVLYVSTGLDRLSVVSFIGSIGTTCLVGFGFSLWSFRREIWVPSDDWRRSLFYGGRTSSCFFRDTNVASISQWWDKKRSIATGVAASGSGIGGLILSLVFQKLLTSVGLQWTLRISAIAIFVVIIGTLPLVKQRVPSNGAKMEWGILREKRFILLLGCIFFSMFPNFIPAYFIPQFAKDVAGLTADDGAVLVSLYNGASAFGRIMVGVLADKVLGRINAFIVSVFSIFNGMVSGGYFVLIPVIVGQVFGVAQLASLVGMSMSLSSIGYLAGPPLAAAIRESLGYNGVCIFAGTADIYFGRILFGIEIHSRTQLSRNSLIFIIT
ncbi:major facilitator superfamily domain-containing protein [Obelidium mucronatum]|nr:major facilitator superfamily domain-containing protein [Obelidium mucronatum]